MNVDGIAETFSGAPNLGGLIVVLFAVRLDEFLSDSADKRFLVVWFEVASWHSREGAKETLNAPAQARRANDARLSTERRSRCCLEPACSAIQSRFFSIRS